MYVVFVDPWTAPFFNTMVLISSGFSLTFAHVSLIAGSYEGCVCGILSCLAQGITFTWYQWKEYLTARFCINNGSFASIFYMATGFHGAHVQIGTGFIIYIDCHAVSGPAQSGVTLGSEWVCGIGTSWT